MHERVVIRNGDVVQVHFHILLERALMLEPKGLPETGDFLSPRASFGEELIAFYWLLGRFNDLLRERTVASKTSVGGAHFLFSSFITSH